MRGALGGRVVQHHAVLKALCNNKCFLQTLLSSLPLVEDKPLMPTGSTGLRCGYRKRRRQCCRTAILRSLPRLQQASNTSHDGIALQSNSCTVTQDPSLLTVHAHLLRWADPLNSPSATAAAPMPTTD